MKGKFCRPVLHDPLRPVPTGLFYRICSRISGRISRLYHRIDDSTTESADSATNSAIVCPLSLSNMFNILNPLDGSRQIRLVGTGLLGNHVSDFVIQVLSF